MRGAPAASEARPEQRSPYSDALGVEVRSLEELSAELWLPFREENSNPGGALHGGVCASLSIIGAHALARAALGEELTALHTAGMQIHYLAAAVREGVAARALLLRKGKELSFVEVTCGSASGKDVSHATLLVRGRPGADFAPAPEPTFEVDGASPGPLGTATRAVSFLRERGIEIEHMGAGRARLRMAFQAEHADGAGGTHEGAALALLDTAGAMASFAAHGLGPYKASTPSMQAQVLGPLPAEALLAHARVVHRDRELFFADVEVQGANARRICARGTILYRIVG